MFGLHNKLFLLYMIISALGFSTSYTDIKFHKIKNQHLLLATICGLAVYAYLIVIQKATFNTNIPLNLLSGLGLGLILYLTDTWGAGDAKLFAVFCLLMPIEKYSNIAPFSSIVIFINIFLLSTLGIIVLSLDEIIKNRNSIMKEIFSFSTIIELAKTFLIIFSLGWLIQPIVRFLMPKITVFLQILILFFSYLLIIGLIKRLRNNYLLVLIFALGLASRFFYQSSDFNLPVLFGDARKIFTYTMIFYSLRIIFDMNNSDEKATPRIPFAPLMFLGTLLANTNLMNWAMQLMNSIRK